MKNRRSVCERHLWIREIGEDLYVVKIGRAGGDFMDAECSGYWVKEGSCKARPCFSDPNVRTEESVEAKATVLQSRIRYIVCNSAR